MKHFVSLEKCACGAYRYLTLRELKKSFQIILVHQPPGRSNERKYLKVAKLSKPDLNFHEARNLASKEGDSLLKIERHARAILASIDTLLENRSKS